MAALSARSSATSWLTRLSGERVAAGRPGPVTAVCADSRRVVPGALFVAIPGFETDGHDYIRAALQRGATALLVEEERRAAWEPFASEADLVIVAVPDTRRASAQAAAGFFGEPGRALGTIGVTGTDGKTTTVHLIAHLLETAGRPAGYLSSVAFRSEGDPAPNDSHMTTLEAPDVQQHLAAMVDAGRDYAVIEASSHGLALHRVDECHFDVAVFTTLSRDHLDFHGSMDEYRKAKGRLFEMLGDESAADVPQAAVLNADDAASDYFRSLTNAPAVTYAIDANADVRAEEIEMSGLAVRFRLVTPAGARGVSARLAGRYNVYNCLAAAAVAHSQGIDLDQIAAGIESFSGVPGRLEPIDAGQPYRVVVDIASTPEALRRVLSVLRPVTEGKLIAVFGCAGERDEARRDGMGRAAGELADFSVLTNEDPRREDPDAIIEAIAAGLREAGRSEKRDFVRLPDRREALRHAFERAGDGDTVLLAGKGTEQSIIIGTEHLPWDEARVARELLKELA
ncbi:MAG: UDP-N-acetylmuramoyl-L-alanyl-D-glutamate--2,6-diaminopimelate ligase [Chloroflexi bacterium]|nr:UDP-N-acetylmuramoyl-L-alanyl-D-glutamate--2,6-diaminopimelate ligase [Chloroflexota bacterium]